jgi:ribosome-associated protein
MEDILLLDLRGLSDVQDFLLLANGSSERQIRSVAEDIEELAEERFGLGRYGREADTGATWYVVDFVDLVVHLFVPPTRAHYDLEMLWGDAGRIQWRRPLNAQGQPGNGTVRTGRDTDQGRDLNPDPRGESAERPGPDADG